MFLAGKVEETPRPLKDVIQVSCEIIIHKKDPVAKETIKQKEVYEQQKELTLLGERVLLVTLGFDLNVHHPYKPLVEAIKKFKVAQNALAQFAWNFVNDGFRTSLCLKFKPHHIAASAIFLAAKFLKVKLPFDGEKVWRQEFDVTHNNWRCLLLKGWKGSSWSFPRGKKNKDEENLTCVIREVLEETGFDVSKLLNKEEHIEMVFGQQRVELYIIAGVKDDTTFAPLTKKEISVSY